MTNYFILAGIGFFFFFIMIPLLNYFQIRKQGKEIEELILQIMKTSSQPLSHAWEIKKSPFFIKSIESNETTIFLLGEIKKNIFT